MNQTIDELMPPVRRMVLAPVLALDLDGTIRRSKSGQKFIAGPDDVELYPDVAPKLWEYRARGWMIVGITNQGGVACGFKNGEDAKQEMHATLAAFGDEHPFSMVQQCYHYEAGSVHPYCYRSLLRKPNIGMLAEVEIESFKHSIICDWDKSLFVGDRPEDQQCAANAGIAFQWAWDFFGREKPA